MEKLVFKEYFRIDIFCMKKKLIEKLQINERFEKILHAQKTERRNFEEFLEEQLINANKLEKFFFVK